MSILIFVMWVLLAAAVIEIICGIVKKSKILIIAGIMVAIMCALGLFVAICFADSIYITGHGMLI